MDGATLIGGAIIGKAQSAFAEILWSKVSDGVRARLTLSKDKLKKAMEVALIYALERTVQQHLYFDSDLFLGNLFERPDTELVDRLLSRENYPTAPELAEAWAKNLANTSDSERSRYAEAMEPQCATFLQEFRRALIHTRILRADPVMADLLALDAATTNTTPTLPSTQAIAALEQQLTAWVENVTDAYQKLSATLSQWAQRRWTTGLHQLPTDYTSELKNFLYEYLGGQGRTVPFGGRQTNLDFLTRWLDDPNLPQRLLIAAEAGRGKSALLARWCAQLQLRGDTHIIFIPISLRFGTAAPDIYFSMLAARLAVIRGETIQHTQLNAAQWKGVCNSYLGQLTDDERVLIVLDGLDESLDPHVIDNSLIPRSLPKQVKIVVSARTQTDRNESEWLRTLGWGIGNLGRSTTLLPLSEKGVRDVLEAMGNPLDHLAERDMVIQSLYRLTEGDPLLVGLYVDALASKGGEVIYITLTELAQIEPGLEGYFDQWWDDQQKQWGVKGTNPLTRPEVEDFFFTLATARGPITKAELQHVLTGTTGPRLMQMAQEVRRFIVGDGMVTGYAFNHPRLGYYFLDQLSETDKVEKHQKYVDFGEKIFQTLKTTTASSIAQKHPYILQHYIYHLEHTQATPEKYYALLCHEWAEAWFALRGTYDGFLADVERIWKRAREDTRDGSRVRGMFKEILCALCQSSIVALSSNIDPQLLELAVKAGIYTPTQAFAIIRQMATEPQRVKAIKALPLLQKVSDSLCQEILEFIRSFQNNYLRADALCAVASHLPLDQALAVALSIQDDYYRAAALCAITPHLPLDQALEVARALPYNSERASVLCAIAQQYEGDTRNSLLQQALELVRSLQDDYFRAVTLRTITPHIPLEQVLEVARSIQDDSHRASALYDIAPRLPLAQALEVARSIGNISDFISLICAIAQQYEGDTRTALLEQGLEVARSFQNNYILDNALCAIAPHMPPEQGLEVALSIQDNSDRAAALCAITPHLPLDQALEVARALPYNSERASVLCAIAQQYEGDTRNSLLQQALEFCLSIQSNYFRTGTLRAITPHLPLEQALEVARSIQDDSHRASVLCAIAQQYEGDTRTSLVQQALEVVRSIKDDSNRVDILYALAPYLPLAQALKVALSIPYKPRRATVLCNIARQHEGDTRTSLVQQALEVARSINDDSNRVDILYALAPYLPLAQALEVARAIPYIPRRATVLYNIAQQHEGDTHSILLLEALEVAHSIGDDSIRAYTLRSFNRNLPLEPRLNLEHALEITHSIKDKLDRATVIHLITTHLPLDQVLEVARSIKDDSDRAYAIHAFATLHNSSTLLTFSYSETLQIWYKTFQYSATFPRPAFLDYLATQFQFIFFFANLEVAQHLSLSSYLSKEEVFRLKSIMIHTLDWATVLKRRQFLEVAGLHSLEPHLPMEATQHDFVYALLQSVQTAPTEDGLSALEKLLRQLLGEWAGDQEARTFVEGLLGISRGHEKSSQQLASEMVKAIQDVCSWWP